MTNTFRRILLCVLAAAMILVCFAGCGEEQSTQEKETSANTGDFEQDPDNPLLEPIAGNREFAVLGRVYAYGTEPYLFQYSEIKDTGDKEDTVNRAVVERNMWIEEKYSVEIYMNNVIPSNIVPLLQQDIMGGSHSYDLVMPIMNTAILAACNGLLTEFGTIPHVDPQKSYWMTDLYDMTSIGGYNFYCSGTINLSAYNTVQTVFFNKGMHEALGLENVYDLVKNQKWTVEKMMELSKNAATDSTGLPTDTYGLLSATMVWQPLFFSSGMTIIAKDSNDLPVFSALKDDANRFFDVIERITDIMNQHNAAAITSAVGVKGGTTFKEGRALFWVECVYGQFTIRDMETDYGMVPIPVWNEGDAFISNIHSGFTSVCAVPAQFNEARLNFVGSVLEDMAYASKKIVIPEYYEKLILQRGSRDAETFEMLDIIYDTILVDLALVLPNITLDSDLRDIVGLNKASVIASTMKDNLTVYEAVMNEIKVAFCKEGAKFYE